MQARFITNYGGHNKGFFQRGPNWVQFTLPARRDRLRCALIVWWAER